MPGRKKGGQESGWKLKDYSGSYNKAEHWCTRRSFNYVEKNNAKALKVTMNISRKRVSS